MRVVMSTAPSFVECSKENLGGTVSLVYSLRSVAELPLNERMLER